jgi:CheY-like chemotaxis protein
MSASPAPSRSRLAVSITPGPGRRAAHVLIVDDNEINLRVATGFCELLGFTSAYARDGVEAVQAVQQGGFDLILMDVCMPRMDGVEATRLIRSLPGSQAKVPIIAITANAEPAEIRSCLQAGMHSVVQKPIRVSRLFDAICDVFKGSPDGARPAP